MKIAWQILFGLNAALIVYVYFGYPLLLLLLNYLNKKQFIANGDIFEPTVSIIIAAYNEEQDIAHKLDNCLSLDYPKSKLEIIAVSDGSTDRTAEIIGKYESLGVNLMNLSKNVGKASAQNEAVKQAKGDILLFTDANVFLKKDALHKLVKHFESDKTGCVIGKVTYNNEDETGVSEGEGLYWRYELFLRHQESQAGNLVSGSGPIMALRQKIFEPLDSAISDDFYLPMKAAIKGYRVLYEPEAVSSERLYQVSMGDMFKTKVRTITLDTRSIYLCRELLNPRRFPLYSLGLISHKILRWLVPYFLICVFFANLLLLGKHFYNQSMLLQIVFYALAIGGYYWQKSEKPPLPLSVPLSFCLVNAAALIGVAKFAAGKKSGSWKPVR